MKRRRFLQLAAGAAAGAAVRPPAFGWLHHEQQVFVPIGDQRLGTHEGLRVRCGEQVRFHFLNARAKEDVQLYLPGHHFTVVALDGNPVPRAAAVDVLCLAKGERIDATVEMNTPGKWILGSLDDAERARGLSLCVSYADQDEPAQWHPPAVFDWSYARFSADGRPVPEPDELIEILLEKNDRSHRWIVNGRSYPNLDELSLQPGHRSRLRMLNATGQAHPVRLKHKFELTRVNQIPVSGIFKDTVRLERYNVIEADVVPA